MSETCQQEFLGSSLEESRQTVGLWIAQRVRPVAATIANERGVAVEDVFEEREYQVDSWGALWRTRQRMGSRALLHLAPSLGKTLVSVLDFLKFEEEWPYAGTTPRGLYACNQWDILHQAQQAFKLWAPGKISGALGRKRQRRADVDFLYASLQSLHSRLDEFDPDEFDYIVWDEGHHLEANTFSKVRAYFDPVFEVCLTATPKRTDRRDITEYFGPPVYSKPLVESMIEGLVAKVDYHVVFDEAVREAMEAGFDDYTIEELQALLAVAPRNEVIAGNIREEQERLGIDVAKTIVFCQDKAHADAMAALLDGEAYHSGISKERRKKILEDFRTGACKTICVRDMFNEGVDIPDATLIAFLRSAESEPMFEQQFGRGLRGRNKLVTVLDFAANIERLMMIRALAERVQALGGGTGKVGRRKPKPPSDDIMSHDDAFDEEDDLQIQTPNATFTFTRLGVNILDKLDALEGTGLLPQGYRSLSGAARELGVADHTVLAMAERLDLTIVDIAETPVGMLRGVSPEVYAVLEVQPEVTTPKPEEGVTSVRRRGSMVGITPKRLGAMMDEMGWPNEKRKFGPSRGRAITDAQVAILRERFPTDFLPHLPRTWFSQLGAADELGTDYETIRRRVAEKGWILPNFKSPGSGRPTPGLSARHIEILRPLVEDTRTIPVADEDEVTNATRFQRSRSTSLPKMRKILAANGSQFGRYLFGPNRIPGWGLTTAQQKMIDDALAAERQGE